MRAQEDSLSLRNHLFRVANASPFHARRCVRPCPVTANGASYFLELSCHLQLRVMKGHSPWSLGGRAGVSAHGHSPSPHVSYVLFMPSAAQPAQPALPVLSWAQFLVPVPNEGWGSRCRFYAVRELRVGQGRAAFVGSGWEGNIKVEW